MRESLRERGILYRLAPHLVRPVPMYMLAGDLRRRAIYRAGLTAYEALAAGRNIGYHTSVSAERVAEAIPGFGGRSRGIRYFECQVDDARLTIEVARAAHAAGARLANHARVTGLLGGGRVTGAAVTDEMTGQGFEVRARTVVNATGIWAERVADLASGSDGVRLRPSKGVHLVFAPGAVRTTAAVVAPSAAHDGRYVFIVPWEDRVYAGTTDTPYQGDLDTPAVGDADRDYILAAVAGLFPGVSDRDVVASWAGLRPLLGQDDAGDTTSSDLSRKHAVFSGPFGLYTITGGKLTTYRAMAEDLVDRVAADLGGVGPVPDAGDPAGAARGGRRGGAAGPGRGAAAGAAAAHRRPAGAALRRRLAAGDPADRRGPHPRRARGRRPAGPGRRGVPGPQPRDGPDRGGHLRPPDPAQHPREPMTRAADQGTGQGTPQARRRRDPAKMAGKD